MPKRQNCGGPSKRRRNSHTVAMLLSTMQGVLGCGHDRSWGRHLWPEDAYSEREEQRARTCCPALRSLTKRLCLFISDCSLCRSMMSEIDAWTCSSKGNKVAQTYLIGLIVGLCNGTTVHWLIIQYMARTMDICSCTWPEALHGCGNNLVAINL